MNMKNKQPTIKVNVSILPFNEAKIVGNVPELDIETKKEKPKKAVFEYEVPKTTEPSGFETKFDGDVFYSVPITSG